MYAQVIDEEITRVIDEQSLREMYPSTHFPAVITQVALDGFENWYVIEDEASMPEYDKSSKKVEFVRAFNGTKVVGTYNVVDLSNAEKLAAKEARKRTKEWYNNIMDQHSCQRCGENDTVVLEWHHTDPTKKDMGVADMLSRRGKKTILEEIEKCICLCANCHRRLHHELRNGV